MTLESQWHCSVLYCIVPLPSLLPWSTEPEVGPRPHTVPCRLAKLCEPWLSSGQRQWTLVNCRGQKNVGHSVSDWQKPGMSRSLGKNCRKFGFNRITREFELFMHVDCLSLGWIEQGLETRVFPHCSTIRETFFGNIPRLIPSTA